MKTLIVGQVAEKIGVQTWQIQSLLNRGLIKPAGRISRWRFFTEKQLDEIRAAAVKSGYLSSNASSVAGRSAR